VPVEAPTGVFSQGEIFAIDAELMSFAGAVEDADVSQLWVEALVLARARYPDQF